MRYAHHHPYSRRYYRAGSLAEAAHGTLIYSLISGSVSRRGNAKVVRLRFRVSNDGDRDANLWDASFRLPLANEVLTPTSGLNDIASRNSVRDVDVTFEVPAEAPRGVLHILDGQHVAELPLDLSPGGRPPGNARADAGDELSRPPPAVLLHEPRPLLAGRGFSATLDRVTSRLFVNKLRIRAAVRLANEGSYPMHSGALTLRLAHGGEVAAPVAQPYEVIDGGTTYTGDYVFESLHRRRAWNCAHRHQRHRSPSR